MVVVRHADSVSKFVTSLRRVAIRRCATMHIAGQPFLLSGYLSLPAMLVGLLT